MVFYESSLVTLLPKALKVSGMSPSFKLLKRLYMILERSAAFNIVLSVPPSNICRLSSYILLIFEHTYNIGFLAFGLNYPLMQV